MPNSKPNYVSVKQLIELRNELNSDGFTSNPSKNVKELAAKLTLVVGYRVTAANVIRCIREFDLDKSKLIERVCGNNNIMLQMSMLRTEVAELQQSLANTKYQIGDMKTQIDALMALHPATVTTV